MKIETLIGCKIFGTCHLRWKRKSSQLRDVHGQESSSKLYGSHAWLPTHALWRPRVASETVGHDADKHRTATRRVRFRFPRHDGDSRIKKKPRATGILTFWRFGPLSLTEGNRSPAFFSESWFFPISSEKRIHFSSSLPFLTCSFWKMKDGIINGFRFFLSLTPSVEAALPLGFLLVSSILPIVKVLLIAATGLIFAQPKIRVLNSGSRHSLSKVRRRFDVFYFSRFYGFLKLTVFFSIKLACFHDISPCYYICESRRSNYSTKIHSMVRKLKPRRKLFFFFCLKINYVITW